MFCDATLASPTLTARLPLSLFYLPLPLAFFARLPCPFFGGPLSSYWSFATLYLCFSALNCARARAGGTGREGVGLGQGLRDGGGARADARACFTSG